MALHAVRLAGGQPARPGDRCRGRRPGRDGCCDRTRHRGRRRRASPPCGAPPPGTSAPAPGRPASWPTCRCSTPCVDASGAPVAVHAPLQLLAPAPRSCWSDSTTRPCRGRPARTASRARSATWTTDFAESVELIVAGRVSLGEMVTHRYSLDEAAARTDRAPTGRRGREGGDRASVLTRTDPDSAPPDAAVSLPAGSCLGETPMNAALRSASSPSTSPGPRSGSPVRAGAWVARWPSASPQRAPGRPDRPSPRTRSRKWPPRSRDGRHAAGPGRLGLGREADPSGRHDP